ncbi:HD domain-containing protein [Noviherbaspirillum sp. CPCC 100848]|uniref:HD domain-containing protein n=1 Tax=Noviherbaspirillum album TaxID=3080276 RepID=A0ABU6JF38_9BURK|nr:HD domain-containing phosphohydrolase [Noviherbaspirillum sp. CPCC 100848]MEC4722028.1 HD domain-containing protein [Noviherbaspirillum sp. CPCC 100848]
MDHRRLSLSDIAIGEPLPWDVYGEGNKLLLRRGHVLQSAGQVESLLLRGLFVDAALLDGAHKRHDLHAPEARRETPSALRFINLANKRLERLLYNLGNESDAASKILEVVKALNYAVDTNADVALASVLLNQQSGSYAIRHSIDTALVASLIARSMRKPQEEIQFIMAAALTMNIGMLRQHDQLCDKQTPLSEPEQQCIKAHVQTSVDQLVQAGITQREWLDYVALHHENDDGSGYPHGKTMADVPQNAKIVSLADRYCACVTQRAYRKTLLPNAALREVLLRGGKPGDAMLAAYFIKEIGTYPPGCFVRLQNGEIGVVTRRAKEASTPVVHAFIGPRGAPLSFPIQRDTGKELFAIRELLPVQQANLRFSMQQLWGDEAAL